MERLLARLDRRFGRHAIENLPMFIVGGMGIVFLLGFLRPELLGLLALSPRLVAQGQVWRLVTYLFIPPNMSMLWILFTLYWVWMIGSNLEAEWGAFKLNAYYFVGMLGTTAAALITGRAQGNTYLNMSLLFAFATLFPEYEILLFLVLPVRMKWLGWISFAFLGYEVATGDWSVRTAVVAALSNYLLFFWGDIVALVRRLFGSPGGSGRRGGGIKDGRPPRRGPSSMPPPMPLSQVRACAICGALETDGADIRQCPCEKCKAASGAATRSLCLEHARNH